MSKSLLEMSFLRLAHFLWVWGPSNIRRFEIRRKETALGPPLWACRLLLTDGPEVDAQAPTVSSAICQAVTLAEARLIALGVRQNS